MAGRRRWNAVCLAGVVLLVAAASRGVGGVSPPSAGDPLARLAASLTQADELVRADFAAVALEATILAYEIEFERLSEPGQVSRRELAKQSRWARALEGFLEELHLARDDLDTGAPVQILAGVPGPVQLLVGERLVEVSSPRIDNPGLLHEEIVSVFCETFPCDPDLLDPPRESPAPDAPVGGWSFRAGMGSTFETVDGLGFMFADVRGRGAKEAACRQVHEELTRLVAALVTASRQGRRVDFDVLAVESVGKGDDQRVVLTRDGARLRMSLPALAQAPGVVEVARPWLRARVQGGAYRQLFPRSDLLLAGLLSAP